MTEKLYDKDSHLSQFDATVISSEPDGDCFLTVLDRTAFFPEGGGQASDIGELDGVAVTDVKIKDEIIYHRTASGFTAGQKVNGVIDFDRRFAFMQNHSGEHIVSGIVNKNYGFDNVGFHLGDDFVTLDFNGILNRMQLDEIEDAANKKIWQNVKFRAYYPDKKELEKIDYRSKKELSGDIRIVEIEDTDICACCAPHVNSASEIGIIKLLDFEKLRGGTRIFMKCGGYALSDYRNQYKNLSEISEKLSVPRENSADAFKLFEDKLNIEKQKNSALTKRIITQIIDNSDGSTLAFEDDLGIRELQMISDGLHKTYGGLQGAFSPTENGLSFAICDESEKLDKFFNAFRNAFAVRGGGRNGMVQGTVSADKNSIEKFIRSYNELD